MCIVYFYGQLIIQEHNHSCTQAHAPGCPVIVVGTHLDAVSITEDDISQNIYQFYDNKNLFPRIAGVCYISNTKHIHGAIKAMRSKIYSVAMRLHTLTKLNGKTECQFLQ